MKLDHKIGIGLSGLMVLFVAALLCVECGCGATGDTQRQDAELRMSVDKLMAENVELKSVIEQHESKTRIEGSARDVIDHAMSAEQRQLEERRLLEQRIERAAQGLLMVGIILIALLTPNVFPPHMGPIAWILAMCCLVGAFALPLLMTLLTGTMNLNGGTFGVLAYVVGALAVGVLGSWLFYRRKE